MLLKIEKISEVHLRVFSDPNCEQELEAFFTYEVPGARFTPKFKARLWDGKVRLYSLIRKTIYVGLYKYILEFAKRANYQVEYVPNDDYPKPLEFTSHTVNDIGEWVKSLGMYARGNPIPARDYQIEAVTTALNLNRTILLSPTASGKSFMIYCILRWHLEEGRKAMIVVPTTSLVEQMYSDFQDYSSNNGFSVQDHCQKLYSGMEKFPSTRYKLTLENNKILSLHGNETIKLINNVYKKVSDLTEGDDIDETWLKNNNL